MSRRPRRWVWYQWFGVNTAATCPACRVRKMKRDDCKTWHREHIIRLALGGPDTYVNLIPICAHCNLKMGKRCASTYEYMALKLGVISVQQALLCVAQQHALNANFDPVCNASLKKGSRCANLKCGKDEQRCWLHIKAQLQPMDTSD